MEQTAVLIRLRKERGLSQTEVAEELGVTRQAVSRWEGGRAWPSAENLVALSRLYGVTVEEMVQGGAAKEMEVVSEESPKEAGNAPGTDKSTVSMSLMSKRMVIVILVTYVCCGTLLWGRLTNSRAAAADYLLWEIVILVVGLIIKSVRRNRRK